MAAPLFFGVAISFTGKGQYIMTDEANEETNVEQTEQQTDDFDGLARRINDVMDKMNAIDDNVSKIGDLIKAFIDSVKITNDTESDNDEKEDDSDADTETPLEELDFSI